jgi:hypothetical protein
MGGGGGGRMLSPSIKRGGGSSATLAAAGHDESWSRAATWLLPSEPADANERGAWWS